MNLFDRIENETTHEAPEPQITERDAVDIAAAYSDARDEGSYSVAGAVVVASILSIAIFLA